jgi:hypothetical protein
MQMQRHVGPLPPPAQLADYEAVYPGAARWIIEEATKNSDHIRTMESRALQLQERDAWLHRLLPFGLVLALPHRQRRDRIRESCCRCRCVDLHDGWRSDRLSHRQGANHSI